MLNKFGETTQDFRAARVLGDILGGLVIKQGYLGEATKSSRFNRPPLVSNPSSTNVPSNL